MTNAPDPVGSGNFVRRNLPRFPNNTELVEDETNADILKHLLPALRKYDCLKFTTKQHRRSPWVRAFRELYHPVGPWGSDKYSNVPDIYKKNNARYSFKSYKIMKIHEALTKYEVDYPVHRELRSALDEYFSKDKYFKDFTAKMKQIAGEEVNKPMGERAPIATLALAAPTTSAVAGVPSVVLPPPTAVASVPAAAAAAPGRIQTSTTSNVPTTAAIDAPASAAAITTDDSTTVTQSSPTTSSAPSPPTTPTATTVGQKRGAATSSETKGEPARARQRRDPAGEKRDLTSDTEGELRAQENEGEGGEVHHYSLRSTTTENVDSVRDTTAAHSNDTENEDPVSAVPASPRRSPRLAQNQDPADDAVMTEVARGQEQEPEVQPAGPRRSPRFSNQGEVEPVMNGSESPIDSQEDHVAFAATSDSVDNIPEGEEDLKPPAMAATTPWRPPRGEETDAATVSQPTCEDEGTGIGAAPEASARSESPIDSQEDHAAIASTSDSVENITAGEEEFKPPATASTTMQPNRDEEMSATMVSQPTREEHDTDTGAAPTQVSPEAHIKTDGQIKSEPPSDTQEGELFNFLTNQQGFFKCSLDTFHEWLKSEDIESLVDLADAVQDEDYLKKIVEHGLKKFKREAFKKSVQAAMEQ